MKPILLAIVAVLFLAGSTLAQQPVQDPAPKCATCANCQCARGACPVQCPPKVVDTRGRWPWQGPFRATGAVGRWTLGIRPRFQANR